MKKCGVWDEEFFHLAGLGRLVSFFGWSWSFCCFGFGPLVLGVFGERWRERDDTYNQPEDQ